VNCSLAWSYHPVLGIHLLLAVRLSCIKYLFRKHTRAPISLLERCGQMIGWRKCNHFEILNSFGQLQTSFTTFDVGFPKETGSTKPDFRECEEIKVFAGSILALVTSIPHLSHLLQQIQQAELKQSVHSSHLGMKVLR
jgi:hypothetical protein